MTASQTQTRRKCGGQKGNRNARKHGFYSGTLSPVETRQLWNITNLEGVDPEIAFIRVKLQSSLQHDPGNRRVIREASRFFVKWYSANYELDPTDRSYLKAVVENVLEIASLRQSASPHGLAKTNGKPTKRIVRTLTTESAAGSHLRYEKELLNSRKHSDFSRTNHPGFPASVRRPPMARKTNWHTDETNRGTLTTESAGGNRLAYEKESSNSWKTSHSYKTNHGASLMLFPPMTQITTFFAYMPILKPSLRPQLASSLLLPLHHE